MKVKIGGYNIPEHNLTYVILTIGSRPVNFGGIAKEGDGQEIKKQLEGFAKQTAVEYEVVDMGGARLTGLCNVVDLNFENVAEKSAKLLRFSGQLEVVV